MMMDEAKATAMEMINNLEVEVSKLAKSLGDSREWSLAITKMEECAMWMRRAVERS